MHVVILSISILEEVSKLSQTLVSQRSHFECAYIYKRDGRYILNAHDYKVEVTVTSPDRVSPVIISFEDLKSAVVSALPHQKFLISNKEGSDNLIDLSLTAVFARFDRGLYCVIPDYICAETLVNYIASRIESNLAEYGCLLWEVKLRESADSYVTWNRAAKL